MAARGRRGFADVWHSLFRIGVGAYWLYFAAQKWPPRGVGWMEPLMAQAGRTNPVPGLHDLLLSVVMPNWHAFAVAQAVGETVVGVLLVVGLATRVAGVLAALLALSLSLTVAFLDTDVGLRWLYYLPVLAGIEVAVNGAGALALDRARAVPAWLRS
jgi:uncharacterized membrane protein YphA (DoxX/SURF4 family)